MLMRSRIVVHRLLLGLACCAVVGALIAPTVAMERQVYDLLVVLDITQSMNVRDYSIGGKPASRLNFAKQALREATLELPCGSRLGLGIFTEYRTYVLFTPVEVCRNQTELANTLDRLNGQMAWALRHRRSILGIAFASMGTAAMSGASWWVREASSHARFPSTAWTENRWGSGKLMR